MLSGIQAPWQVQLQARARLAEGTQGAPRKMRRQGAATPEATHRVSVGVAPSIRLPRQPRTAPLRRLPPHRSPWRRQFGARHPGSTAENAAAGRSNPGVHSPGVCGMCPQPPLAAAAAHRPAQALATCSPAKRPAPKIGDDNNGPAPKFVQSTILLLLIFFWAENRASLPFRKSCRESCTESGRERVRRPAARSARPERR